jgi:hypothetical protein
MIRLVIGSLPGDELHVRGAWQLLRDLATHRGSQRTPQGSAIGAKIVV